MLNEKGLAAVMRERWRGGGYEVAEADGWIMIWAGGVAVRCRRAALPRKCLGMIVEHIGEIPEGVCYRVSKEGGAQTALRDEPMDFWSRLLDEGIGSDLHRIKPTQLHLNGARLWQDMKDLRVVTVDPGYTRVVEPEALSEARTVNVYETGLVWEDVDCVAVVMPLRRNDTDRLLPRLDGFPWCGEETEVR